jgi:hypothetical protein
MIEDLRSVQKQHFEIENINESLEQRIEQLKSQRDLAILISQTGQKSDLQGNLQEAKEVKKQ